VFDLAGNPSRVSVWAPTPTPWRAGGDTRPWRLPGTADGADSGRSGLLMCEPKVAAFADRSGLQITVTFCPPATSTGHRIKHRWLSARA